MAKNARKTKDKKQSTLSKASLWVAAGLVAASVGRELWKPPAERTWCGDLWGIPYDYRKPTVDKVKATFWAPEDERIVMPRAFGVGWDVNVGRVVRLAREFAGEASAHR